MIDIDKIEIKKTNAKYRFKNIFRCKYFLKLLMYLPKKLNLNNKKRQHWKLLCKYKKKISNSFRGI